MSNALNQLVNGITSGYRLSQMIGTLLLFVFGFIVSYAMCGRLGKMWSFLLAIPVGNAVWGAISALLLFCNVPYNGYTMTAMLLLVLLLLLWKRRSAFLTFRWLSMGNGLGLGIVLAITLAASFGLFPMFYSSDSYYFVMQYGELIAMHGELSSDIAGAFMTWTGITPALMSSYAAMWGFETIYGIHYLLVFSMYGLVAFTVYQCSLKHFKHKASLLLSLFSLITLVIIPAVSYLSIWVIGNTYFMIYVTFLIVLSMLPREDMDNNILCIMSLFVIWLTLSRPEGALVMCFFIICISARGLERNQFLRLYLPMCLYQLLFFGKLIYEYVIGARQAESRLLTTETAAILLLSLLLTGIYSVFYNCKLFCLVRKYMTVIVLSALLLACLGLGMLEPDKLRNNLDVIRQNLEDWYWKYVPITVLLLEIMKSCNGCRNKYFDLIVWGFILCNFAVCMGRPQYLRVGVGDSYNRMCMSIIPVYVVTTICSFLERFGKSKSEAESR